MCRTPILVLLVALAASLSLAQNGRGGGHGAGPGGGPGSGPGGDPGGNGPGGRPRPGGYGAGVDVWVPIDPYEHERTWYMHRSDRTLVPPAVSIDRDPYVCDLDDRRFADREAFVAHLRGEHGIPRDEIRRGIYQNDGLVHFAAE